MMSGIMSVREQEKAKSERKKKRTNEPMATENKPRKTTFLYSIILFADMKISFDCSPSLTYTHTNTFSPVFIYISH